VMAALVTTRHVSPAPLIVTAGVAVGVAVGVPSRRSLIGTR
jgi:hypothetical protein